MSNIKYTTYYIIFSLLIKLLLIYSNIEYTIYVDNLRPSENTMWRAVQYMVMALWYPVAYLLTFVFIMPVCTLYKPLKTIIDFKIK